MTHGKRNTRLYSIYAHIKERCYNANNKSYHYYGAKGIIICDEWLHDFQAFYDWAMANGYADNLTIDRIDVNGNYEPSNCRWVTMKEQSNNKSCNISIAFNGKTQTLKQWADELGINYTRLYQRIYVRGWSVEKAFDLKGNSNERLITYKGKTQTMKQWAADLDINYRTLAARLNQYHWSVEKALTTK